MEADFWLQRWQQQRTGFHQHGINFHLERFWQQLQVAPGEQVFVPLCGKSLDMLWLRAQHRVLGVELSPIAVNAFLTENGLLPQRREEGGFVSYEMDGLQLLCGDFFDLQPEQLRHVRAVYDRASLIALPPHLRSRYVARLNELLPAAVPMLLVTMEYEQQQMQGPPFAVHEQEIHALFAESWSVKVLHLDNILAREARFRERGLSRLSEKVYLLNKQ